MMYLHFCNQCTRIHLLNGHKTECPKCAQTLTELSISYMSYINMDLAARQLLIQQCTDQSQLAAISTVYRMHKYSKSRKSLQQEQDSNTEQA